MPMYFKTTHDIQLNFQAKLEIVSQLGYEKMTRQGFERPCVVLVPVDRKVKVMNRCRFRHPLADDQGFEPLVQAPVGPTSSGSDVDDHVLHILVLNVAYLKGSTGPGSTPVHGAWWMTEVEGACALPLLLRCARCRPLAGRPHVGL